LAQQKLFEKIPSRQSGLKFSNEISETEGLNVLAYEYFYNGAGVAVGDFDKDGWQDLLFTANMKENKLFRNLGNMKFKDVTREAGKALEGRRGGWKTGVTVADVNNDGLPDIYICYSGKTTPDNRRNELFINQGNWKFEEKARDYGLDDPGFSTQAVFLDFDRDGDLDMFLLNHSTLRIDNLEFTRYRDQVDEYAGSKLFENENGKFVDVSRKAGIRQSALTYGLGVVVADINLDGWEDLYVTNDYNEPDYLYINNGDGTFSDKAGEYLTHLSQFSMGADIADYNNDGLPDIFTLDMFPEDNKRQKLLQLQENYELFDMMQKQGLEKQYMRNMLHLNNGDGTFSEIGQFAGISNTDWSWSPLVADFDNDGYKDFFVSNGYLRDYTNKDFLKYRGDYKVKKAIDREPMLLMDLVKNMPSTKIPNYIFRNNHDLTFENMRSEWGLDEPVMSSGAAYADFDNDGDLDLVINNINEEAFLYKNNTREKAGGGYLALKLTNKAGAPATGSKVYVYTGGKEQYQELNPYRGYLSCVTPVLNFGLGNIEKIDSLKIIWPDDSETVLRDQPVNQVKELNYTPAGKKESGRVLYASSGKTIFTKAASPVTYSHSGFNENDFKRQQLMLFMYSSTGPVMAAADVNNDGKEDLFISGTKESPGKIYLQQGDGGFKTIPGLAIVDEKTAAVSAACFADLNGDGWQDLYVAKGGYSVWEPNTESLQDELYINNRQGGFTLEKNKLPQLNSSAKSCIRPCDYDGDGDIDLFIGGRVIPGQYPMAPESFLLTNDGKGNFTKTRVPFDHEGMITDAAWYDVNGDGKEDLLLAGEMMPLTVYLNRKEGFEKATEKYFDSPVSGFWFSIKVEDVNGDGKKDIVAGNLGLNTQIKCTPKEPAVLYYDDFDQNGSVDPFLTFYINGKSYPYVSRDELNDQIYAMRRKFSTYEQYSTATIDDIFSRDELNKAGKWKADETETVLFIRSGDRFVKKELPAEAQFSPVTRIESGDFDHDGYTDLLLFGNLSENRLKFGAIDANYGCLLLGDGKGEFRYAGQNRSGMAVRGDVKSVIRLKDDKASYLLIGVSNDKLCAYEY